MAPTKANATYAVTTLSLLTKVIGKSPWFTSLPVVTRKTSKPFQPEKVSLAVAGGFSTMWNRRQRG
jgi:hypothetical protein